MVIVIPKKGVTSKEHDDAVAYICSIFNLTPVEIKTCRKIKGKGKYFPDAKNNNCDYEVEMVPEKTHILDKIIKWDSSRKKVLVLNPKLFIYDKFDEIYILSKTKNLIKLK